MSSGSVGTRAAIFAVLSLVAIVLIMPTFACGAGLVAVAEAACGSASTCRAERISATRSAVEQAVDNTVDRVGRDLERELEDGGLGAFTVDREGRKLVIRLANKRRSRKRRAS